MTPKSVLILGVVTAFSVVAAFVSVNLNRGYATSAGDGLLFPDLMDKVDSVTKVVVSDKDQEIAIIRM